MIKPEGLVGIPEIVDGGQKRGWPGDLCPGSWRLKGGRACGGRRPSPVPSSRKPMSEVIADRVNAYDSFAQNLVNLLLDTLLR